MITLPPFPFPLPLPLLVGVGVITGIISGSCLHELIKPNVAKRRDSVTIVFDFIFLSVVAVKIRALICRNFVVKLICDFLIITRCKKQHKCNYKYHK